jgi:hypothetical protein
MLRTLFAVFAIIVLNTGVGAQTAPGFPKAASPKYSAEPTAQAQKRWGKQIPSPGGAKSTQITSQTRAQPALSAAEQPTPAEQEKSPAVKDDANQFAAMIANYEVIQCRSTAYPEIRVDVKAEYEAVFVDNGRLTPLLNFLWKKAQVICDDEVRLHGVPPARKLGTFISVLVRLLKPNVVPPNFQFDNEVAGFGSTDGIKWDGENRIGQKILRQRQLEQLAQERARQEQQGQAQRVALRQKIISDYGIETWANRRDLVANPFSFRGRIIGLSVSFGQMLSEKEAVFSGGGEFVVTRVPPTMFRGNESVILAAKVVGNKSVRTPTGGEITVPYLEFVGAWPLAEKRAQIIRHLEGALALAAEIQDGPVGFLIERALDEALPPVRPGGTTGETVGVGGRSFLDRNR